MAPGELPDSNSVLVKDLSAHSKQDLSQTERADAELQALHSRSADWSASSAIVGSDPPAYCAVQHNLYWAPQAPGVSAAREICSVHWEMKGVVKCIAAFVPRNVQELLNGPFLNGLFSRGFSRGKTAPVGEMAHKGMRGNNDGQFSGHPAMVEKGPSEEVYEI